MKDKEFESEKEFVLDADAVNAISEQVVSKVLETTDKVVQKKIEEMDKYIESKESFFAKETEKKKSVSAPIIKKFQDIEKQSKEVRLVKAVKALLDRDYALLKSYNEYHLDLYAKTGYNNTTVDADGGYIVLDPLFEAEVEKIAPNYGVALRDADIRTINSGSVKTNKRGSNVTMYEIGQGASITASKLTIEQISAELRKFAGLSIATNELLEDQAVDFWGEVLQGFAEERARVVDLMVFNDTSVTYPGLMQNDSVIVESVGATIASLVWDDLMNAEAAVPTVVGKTGKHYMHRSVWNILRQAKSADDSHYLFNPALGMQTPWGTPVELTDSLPSSSVVGDSNEPYLFFGDLKKIKVYIRKGLVIDQSADATVTDTEAGTVNLFQQDMTALRIKTRMLAINKFPEAFCAIGTGTVS